MIILDVIKLNKKESQYMQISMILTGKFGALEKKKKDCGNSLRDMN